MRLAIVPSWYSSERAPTRGSFVREQAIALAERGLEVSVFVLDRDAGFPLFDIRRTIEDGLPHVRLAAPWPMHRLFGFYAPTLVARRLAALVRAFAPDVVHAHAVRPAGVVSALVARRLDIPLCLTEHSGPLRAFWWTGHGRRQMDQAFAACDRLFAVSSGLARDMRQCFPEGAARVEVLHNGIETGLFRPDPKPRVPADRLLFVGGLVPEKDVSTLLKALAMLPPGRDWTLSLVGIGPLEQTLRDEAAALGIGGRLQWRGSVPRAAMPQLFRDHDLLVVSSVAETFSLVSAEALACGVPVVATRCGGPEEVIGPLGLPLVEPGDPEALSQAILDMLSRLSEFDRMAAARSVAERFSMATLAKRLEAVYAQMIGERR